MTRSMNDEFYNYPTTIGHNHQVQLDYETTNSRVYHNHDTVDTCGIKNTNNVSGNNNNNDYEMVSSFHILSIISARNSINENFFFKF